LKDSYNEKLTKHGVIEKFLALGSIAICLAALNYDKGKNPPPGT